MKHSVLTKLVVMAVMVAMLPLNAMSKGRKQWTEKQAWVWQKRLGVIKGFNQGELPYPNMSREEVIRKGSELGLNSIRTWLGGGTAENQIKFLKATADYCEKYGMTVSPVLTVPVPQSYYDSNGTDEAALKSMKEYTQKMIGAFAHDKRVVLWDLWNEPGNVGFDPSKNKERFMLQLKAIDKILEWSLELNPDQALSSSIFWRGDLLDENASDVVRLAWEVESHMDVHNFHLYSGDSAHTERLMNCLRKIGNRPVVATECMTRSNNATLARTFANFQKYNVHFYLWGLYMCDANWSIKWHRSAYDPYDVSFHDLLHPDGEPIDRRDMDEIKNYRFTSGQPTDIGAEWTDRWAAEKAWRWMAAGPIKGKALQGNMEEVKAWLNGSEAQSGDFNSLTVEFSMKAYKENKDQFFKQTKEMLAKADEKGFTVMPTLITDEIAAQYGEKELIDFVGDVVNRYYNDSRIQAWNLYQHPGKTITDSKQLTLLLQELFRRTRKVYPNQPVLATPWVEVKPFAVDFNYHDAMLHGRRNGWNYLAYSGGSNADLCYTIWKLSDVIAFSSKQSAAQAGWLKSVAFRYGRPIFCTDWKPSDVAQADELLDNFARSHVYWYHEGQNVPSKLRSFKFLPICTPH